MNLSTPNMVYKLTSNISLSSGSNCLNITAENVTLDCQGRSITGSGKSNGERGVYSNQPNTTVKNCNISQFEYAIYPDGSSYGQILNNTLTSNYDGVYLYNSSYRQILNNTLGSNEYGLDLDYESDYNNVTYNNFTNNWEGFYVDYSDSNQIGYNNVINTEQFNYGSCPFLFLSNGSEYNYYTDLGGEPLGAPWFKPQEYQAGIYELGNFQPTDGVYQLKIREVIPESDYLDEAKLAVVDVPQGYEVLNQWSYTYPFNQAPSTDFMTIKDPIAPISATDSYGNDVLAEVSQKDGIPVPIYNGVQNPITLDFGPIQNPQYAKLIMTGWAAYEINPNLTTENYLLVQTPDANGSWVTRKSFGGFVGDSRTIVFNISGILQNNDTRMRIIAPYSPSTIHVIDQVLLDDSEPVGFNVTYIDPSTADLQWGGSLDYVYATAEHRHLDITDEHNPSNPNFLMYGNFTKYGDVSPLLSSADDEFVVMRSGDELLLEFNDPPRQAGTDRYAFLLADDMYTIENSINGFITNSINPMPFHGMSQYPYGANESYPTDSDHQAYIADWNTRDFTAPSSVSIGGDMPESFNNTVYNNNITGESGSTGLYLNDENNTRILNNNISNVSVGIALYTLDYGTVNTEILNNTINSSSYCLYIDSSSANNTALHNTLIGNHWVHDEDGSNYYNDSTSGNIYYLANGTRASKVYNITSSTNTWADGGSDRPFNSSLSGGQWADLGEDWHPWVGTLSSALVLPTGGAGGPSREFVKLSESFNCQSGELTVSTGVPSLGLQLFDVNDATFTYQTTDSNGMAVFAITQNGNYEVYSNSTEEYIQTTLGPFGLTLCNTIQPAPPANNTTPNQNVTPQQNQTVTPPANQTAPQNQTQPTGPTKGDAQSAISAANSAISSAANAGKDVTDAREKLDDANAAFSAGNYTQAVQLADEADQLALNASNATAPVQTSNTNVTAPQVQQSSGWLSICGGVVLLVIVVVLIILYLRSRKEKED
jgi:parallel beta-helix repeat protein